MIPTTGEIIHLITADAYGVHVGPALTVGDRSRFSLSASEFEAGGSRHNLADHWPNFRVPNVSLAFPMSGIFCTAKAGDVAAASAGLAAALAGAYAARARAARALADELDEAADRVQGVAV